MRCYEWYCLPKKCEELSTTGKIYANKYIKLMDDNGVLFNKTPEDKELFLKMRQKYGSEAKYSRSGHVRDTKPIKTKLQMLSEIGLTEEEVQNKIGFAWDTLSQTELQRAMSTKKETIPISQPSMTPNESIEEIECIEDEPIITCPNCGWEIEQ